jgi:hypothetical protein
MKIYHDDADHIQNSGKHDQNQQCIIFLRSTFIHDDADHIQNSGKHDQNQQCIIFLRSTFI